MSASLLAATAIGGLGVMSPEAAAGCRVDDTVTNRWAGGFGASVTVTNLGDRVESWELGWAFAAGQTITQLWNGTATQSGAAGARSRRRPPPRRQHPPRRRPRP